MRKKSTVIPILFMIVSLVAVISLTLQLTDGKDETSNEDEKVEKATTEKVAGVAHNPPSLDDVPEGPLGDAILRGYELTNDTSNVLRAEAASVEDGEQKVNALLCTSCHAGAGWMRIPHRW